MRVELTFLSINCSLTHVYLAEVHLTCDCFQVNIELVHRCYDEEELLGFEELAAKSTAIQDVGKWHRRRSTCLSDRYIPFEGNNRTNYEASYTHFTIL